MHHIHVEREVPHWWETHGDYRMDPKFGYHTALPPGACVSHDGMRPMLYAMVNGRQQLRHESPCISVPVPLFPYPEVAVAVAVAVAMSEVAVVVAAAAAIAIAMVTVVAVAVVA